MPDLRLCTFLLLTAAMLSGCGRTAPTTATEPREIVHFDHRFAIEVGGKTVQMRIAILPHEQRRGLMHVKEMPEDEGMLFLHEAPRRVSFWMRNTYIPLDIGYFDTHGALLEVHRLFPHVEDPVLSISEDIRYALEMNHGWYARNKVGAGATIDLEALAAAIEARGMKAASYVDLN